MGKFIDEVRAIILGPVSVKDSALMAALFGGRASASGVVVSEETAMGLATVRSCVGLLAGTEATCPPYVYRRERDGSRRRDDAHPVTRLLTREPNAWQTSMAMREAAVTSMLLRGVAYIEVTQIDQGGRPYELVLRHPDCVTLFIDPKGDFRYRLTTASGAQREVPYESMCAVLGPHSPDGITPVSVLTQAREVFGVALAQDRFASTFFANNARPSGVLQHAGRLTDDAHRRLRDSWMETYGGLANVGKPAILEEGLTWNAISLSNEDAELLASRRWSAEEICKLFNVPPAMVGVATTGSGLTYRNVEDEQIRFLQFSVLPILKRFEAAYNRTLISSLERNGQYVEHDTAGMLRTDLMTRYNAYAVGRQWGWLSADDVRQRENLPPLPDGAGAVYGTAGALAPAAPGTSPAQVTASLRGLVEDVARRLVFREATRAKDAASTPERLRQLLAEAYLNRASVERAHCEEMFVPAVRHVLAVRGSALAAPDVVRAALTSHFAQSERALRAVLETATPETLRRRVVECTNPWFVERVRTLADAFTTAAGPTADAGVPNGKNDDDWPRS